MGFASPSVFLGSFNAEQFWRSADASRLPAIADPQADAIVSTMDELGFAFCTSPQDLLMTLLPMDDTHKHYLAELGFGFANNAVLRLEEVSEIQVNQAKGSHPTGICQRLVEAPSFKYFQQLMAAYSHVSPYSIEPYTDKFCQYYGLERPGPDITTIRTVNSKVFSHQLAKELFPDTTGGIIHASSELEPFSATLTEGASFLIKDEFGVSGKGNLLISSPQILKRIVKHLSKQERAGKTTRFLLEPFLDKDIDFSCQFEIDVTGQLHVRSVQTMENSGFAFSSIQTADQTFQDYLERQSYFEQVEAIAKRLYQVGYYGPVCLDSMRLKNGSIVPIIEINARKSMGFINHYLDRFFAQFSARGNLTFFNLGYSNAISFAHLLEKMKQENILFLKHKPTGILPLSANALTVNWQLRPYQEQKMYKGRLYASIVAGNEQEKMLICNKMDQVFAALNIHRLS